MLYNVRYFTEAEMACKCGCGEKDVAAALVLWLDLIRRAWGGPVIVNSARRCEKHNAAVGGAPHSRHLLGCAADITCSGAQDKARFQDFAALVTRLCPDQSDGWEVIVYQEKRFVHVGVPRFERLIEWDGKPIPL